MTSEASDPASLGQASLTASWASAESDPPAHMSSRAVYPPGPSSNRSDLVLCHPNVPTDFDGCIDYSYSIDFGEPLDVPADAEPLIDDDDTANVLLEDLDRAQLMQHIHNLNSALTQLRAQSAAQHSSWEQSELRLRGQVEQIMVENIDLHRQLLALQKRHVAVLEMLVQQQDASKPTAVGSNSHHLQHTFPFHASSSCQQDGQLFSASSQDRPTLSRISSLFSFGRKLSLHKSNSFRSLRPSTTASDALDGHIDAARSKARLVVDVGQMTGLTGPFGAKLTHLAKQRSLDDRLSDGHAVSRSSSHCQSLSQCHSLSQSMTLELFPDSEASVAGSSRRTTFNSLPDDVLRMPRAGTLPPRGRDASHSRSCPADLPPKATPNRSKGSLGSILQSSLSLSRLGSSARSSTNATSTAGMSRSSSGDGSSAQGATQQQGSRSIDALPTSARGEADARTEADRHHTHVEQAGHAKHAVAAALSQQADLSIKDAAVHAQASYSKGGYATQSQLAAASQRRTVTAFVSCSPDIICQAQEVYGTLPPPCTAIVKCQVIKTPRFKLFSSCT
eukprot:jgi/Chrzof1/200/Cz01g06240.t1